MFVLDATHEYDWPIDVQKPVDGGRFERHRFTCRFRVAKQDVADAYIADADQSDSDFLSGVVVGWGDDVASVDGKPLPFSTEALHDLAAIPYVRVAIIKGYFDSVRGAAAKN